MTWQARPYQQGDEHEILKLRRAVFGQVDPVRALLDTWRWQFQCNPAGPGFIMLAEDRGDIVGQYAAIPVRMLVDGEEILCGYSCDTMVHPDYHRQRIFVSLANLVYEDMEINHGIHSVWGFPNENSMPGFTKKLGWQSAGCFLARITLPKVSALLGDRRKERRPLYLGKGVEAKPIMEFGPEFDQLWREHKPQTGIIQVRDRAYLQWRYLGVAGFEYEPFGVFLENRLQGYFVLRFQTISGVRVCSLVDSFPILDPKTMDGLATAVRDYGALRGCAMAVALFPRSLDRQASQWGFYAVPQRIAPKVFHLAGRFVGETKWLDDSRWWLSLGDTDVV
ncbi:MAG: GNAT family N-acetyltransferase [Desulfatibacillum sp.]|nr:GNAT family N-acetyltransferase [Desulfatibacillum sp.]